MLILPSPGTACQGHPRLGPHVPVPTSLSPRTHVPTEHLTLLSRGLGGAHRKHEQQQVWKPAPSLAQGWSPGASTFLPDSETSGNLIEISKRALEVCNHPRRGPGPWGAAGDAPGGPTALVNADGRERPVGAGAPRWAGRAWTGPRGRRVNTPAPGVADAACDASLSHFITVAVCEQLQLVSLGGGTGGVNGRLSPGD